MDESLIYVLIAAFLVNTCVMYEVIKAASKYKKIEGELRKQTELIAHLALKNGVPDEL